jgi:hypothetical protein
MKRAREESPERVWIEQRQKCLKLSKFSKLSWNKLEQSRDASPPLGHGNGAHSPLSLLETGKK